MTAKITRSAAARAALGLAALLADKGDPESLDEARYKLVDAQNALEDIVLDSLADGRMLVNSLRAELVQLIKLMDTPEIYKAQGRPYALASETSHGRQRYCARGGARGAGRRWPLEPATSLGLRPRAQPKRAPEPAASPEQRPGAAPKQGRPAAHGQPQR